MCDPREDCVTNFWLNLDIATYLRETISESASPPSAKSSLISFCSYLRMRLGVREFVFLLFLPKLRLWLLQVLTRSHQQYFTSLHLYLFKLKSLILLLPLRDADINILIKVFPCSLITYRSTETILYVWRERKKNGPDFHQAQQEWL